MPVVNVPKAPWRFAMRACGSAELALCTEAVRALVFASGMKLPGVASVAAGLSAERACEAEGDYVVAVVSSADLTRPDVPGVRILWSAA